MPRAHRISDRNVVITKHHRLFYERVDMPDSGYSFECDCHGVIDVNSLTPTQLDSLNYCNSRLDDFKHPVVETTEQRHVEPAVIECQCGHHLALYMFTNTCRECGADYDRIGYRLANRSQWGCETGETSFDVLGAGHYVG